jgi:hypothetical protein
LTFVRWLLRGVLRSAGWAASVVGPAMTHLGAVYFVLPLTGPPEEPVFGLPANHPERLVAHVPLSAEEARLWAQLLKEAR